MALLKPLTESPSGSGSILDSQKEEMFGAFQTWALKNYGDSGKTKTVTRKKYDRIVRTLNGEEQSSAENSKFRFWVKAKGFRLGPLESSRGGSRRVLFVPSRNADCNSTSVSALTSPDGGWGRGRGRSHAPCEHSLYGPFVNVRQSEEALGHFRRKTRTNVLRLPVD
ncbi:hypothetical protein BaRGS_00004798, partial [Batillaria attramentaria]